MIYRKLHINVWIRVAFILVNCFLLTYSFFTVNDFLINLNLLALLIIQVVLMVKSFNRINQDLENFFNAVRNNDSSIVFSRRMKSGGYSNLYSQFDLINQNIQRMKIELENKNQYFKVLVEHVGIGLISFTDNGKITLCNRAVKELLNRPQIFRIQELDDIRAGFSKLLMELKPSEQRLVSVYRNDEMMQLSIKATELKVLNETIKLVSLQNIKSELDEKELDSWQKLIRVLTHEIMNSIGPINSTIATLIEFLTDEETGSPRQLEELNAETLEDTVDGLNIIEERSRGMLDFVIRFRNLTFLPKPEFSTFPIEDLFRNIQRLMAEKFRTAEVKMDILISQESISLKADRGMVEQILINLLSNSIQGVEGVEDKRIVLKGFENSNGRVEIQVLDNGKGIPSELQDKIFIPFFTTKEGGSGIGLSLSRQMMRLHGGTLSMRSQPEVETVFQMKF